MRIIKEPKNSLMKQFEYLLEMDGVKLTFEKDAIVAIAELALERNTGARGLRAIMESIMTEIMYEVPSRDDIKEVKITTACVKEGKKPKYILKAKKATAPKELKAAE